MPQLPKQFADLQSFASEWSLATRAERYKKRTSSSMEEIKAFYDAVLPQLDAMVAYLDKHSIKDLAQEEKNLLRMAFSAIEISRSVEVWNSPDNVVHGAYPAERIKVHTLPYEQAL